MRASRLAVFAGSLGALVFVSAPVPATTTAPANSAAGGEIAPSSALGEKIRELLSTRTFDRMTPRKTDRDAIAALYRDRSYAPIWLAGSGPNARAKAAIAHLRGIEVEALDPADYPVPDLAATEVDAQAEADVRFTAVLLTFARHAQVGRIHFSRISQNIDYKDRFDAAETLKRIANGDIAATLESFHPPHAAYRALKAKLAQLRAEPADRGPIPIPNGPVLRYGKDKSGKELVMVDQRVPAVRERLGLPAADNTRYDKPLADAIAAFQKRAGLKPDGQLTAATIAAINGPTREQRLQSVMATMERWRWVPREFGNTHVMLNIPDFHLRVMSNQQQVWMTRVVVGKPTQATPILTETMKFITVNPTWNVPQSIIYNELLPIYETSDPSIFAKMGLKVERRSNGEIRVFQPPGEANALGRIRFNFPNKFLVYQHDTPEKHFFAYEKRAYSHGCMRVQDPIKYAEVLLSLATPRGNYTQDSIKKMFGGEEKQIDLATPIPVHITYQTAFVDDQGQLQFRDDIYGLDARHFAVLKSAERAVADVGMERPADPNFQPTSQHRQRMQNVAGAGNPFALFDRLFR